MTSALSDVELLNRGADCWDQRRFFDAHEEWEAAWMPLRGTLEGDRRKGSICFAGALVHLASGRGEPARRLLLRAVELLRPTADPVRDEALRQLRERAAAALADVAAGDLQSAVRRAGRFPRAGLFSAGTEDASVG